VLPKPPFRADLSLDQEIEAFERLKPRLADVWTALSTNSDAPGTSVVVPSLTLDREELTKLAGASYYEERLLFLLIRLRNPRAHVIYVTSQPVHPLTLEYYLTLLAGVPASHARARLTMLCAHDGSPRPLTEKILERPRLIQRIRYAAHDHGQAYLTVFNSTPLERRLSVLLDIPLNGLDPQLCHLGSKSGGRRVFKEAGVAMPAGVEDINTPEDAADALLEVRRQRPAMKRALIKLNDSFSGEGNAVVTLPETNDRGAFRQAIDQAAMPVPSETPARYFEKLHRMGGVVEEFLEAPEKQSPSAQFRTGPSGEVLDVSTHDQILGGDSGQIYLGCTFPAKDGYRLKIRDAGRRIACVLARHGVVSRFGIDFLAWRNRADEDWHITALEINLRIVGTTHPFLALRFLTGGQLHPGTGQFVSLSQRAKHYRATDNLRSERYRGLLPDDLFDILSMNDLHYSHRTESGVLFHMIGALSEFGKLGLTVIGNDDDEVARLYDRTIQVLDLEASLGHGSSQNP
jgi:pheganomycin biosynthesis PGM1-like protein